MVQSNLKTLALQHLARREHSRLELEKKLSKYAQTTEIPITYWFEKEKSIAIQDLFLPGIDALAVIHEQVDSIKKMRLDNDEFATFSAADYQYITCTTLGLLCRTTFSTVYGQDTILLPVEDIRKYLRKNALPIW